MCERCHERSLYGSLPGKWGGAAVGLSTASDSCAAHMLPVNVKQNNKGEKAMKGEKFYFVKTDRRQIILWQREPHE